MSDLPSAYAAPLRFPRPALLARIAKTFSETAEAEAIRRSREKLAEYDDHLLRDIGMTREEVLRGAPRSAWNAPDWWVMVRGR